MTAVQKESQIDRGKDTTSIADPQSRFSLENEGKSIERNVEYLQYWTRTQHTQ